MWLGPSRCPHSPLQTDPEVAGQALTKHADEEGMRFLCLNALANYGSRATSAVPFLMDMMQSQKLSRQHDVFETLNAIDPEAVTKERVR